MACYTPENLNGISMVNDPTAEHSCYSLLMGIQSNNVDLVRCSIDVNIDPSRIKHNDSTLLHYAIQQNNPEIVKAMISFTKDINVLDTSGKTPLLVAVESNSEAYNAVQQQNPDDTAKLKFHEQTVENGQKIIEILLEAGADICIADRKGTNPVFAAVSSSNIPLIDCLLHRGLSKDPKTFANILRDSLLLATRFNNKDVIQILLENYSVNIDIEDSQGMTPLQVAIEDDHREMVEYLIDNGANVRGNASNYYTKVNDTLVKNVSDSSTDDSLLENSQKTTVPNTAEQKLTDSFLETPPYSSSNSLADKESLTPLHIAAIHNRLEIARILIERGADPDATPAQCQFSPLLTAISRGHTEMAELLLRYGADPNEMVNFMGISSCYLLHCAVLNGNLDVIKILVENGAKINIYDKNNMSPLSLAVLLQMHHIVDYFLNAGAFVNSSQSNVHPLHQAVIKNDLDSVRKLAQYGADVEATDEHGKTALYLAVEKNHFHIAKCLIEIGANVNVKFKCDDVDCFTPLHMATINSNVQMAKLLLDNGARSHPENSPIYLAIAAGNIELFNIYWANRFLIEGPESGTYWERNNTAIHWAVRHDQLHMLQLLHGLGGNLNMPDKDGYTPLFRAMLRQNTPIVGCLVRDGALLNDPCTNSKYKQWMPIHMAAYSGNLPWVQIFVQYGASIHATTDDHMNPLWLAVKRGHFDVTMYLLEHRADVHCRNILRYHNNNTLLHVAIQNRRLDIVKLLVQFKADVNYENDKHRSPLAIAIRECDYAIAKYLLKKGAKIHSASIENQLAIPFMNIAVALNQKQLVQLLLQHGAGVDDVDKEGRTPLAVAIERGHAKMVKYLLKHGADANAAYRLNGQIIVRTLFLAISSKHAKIVKMLLKYSVDINAPLNSERHTPLLLAVLLGYNEIAEMLLNMKNVDLDAVDVNGMSALHQAVINENKDLMALMVEFGASTDLVDNNGFTPMDYCKDGTMQKLSKLYLTKQQCLKLNDRQLAIYIDSKVHDVALNNLIDLCMNELARLKKKSIAGITLYELLKMNGQECGQFFQEITHSQAKKLSHYLKSDKVKDAYPNFIYMLRRKILTPSDE